MTKEEEEKKLINEQSVEEQQDTIEEEEQQQQLKKPKIKWLPLESNPDVLNKIIHKNGVNNPEWSFVDVLGLDDELLALIPRPVAAIIFLFPGTDNYDKFREKEEAHLKIHEQNISPNLMYFKQTISNACGMMALLHSLSNNDHLVGPGLFNKIIQDTRNMSPEERGEYLESCKALAEIHDDGACHGQSKTPDINDPVSNHFISFVQVDGHLYELDGTRAFPINHGKCTDFIQDSAKIIRQAVERDPNENDYCAIAFVKTPTTTNATAA